MKRPGFDTLAIHGGYDPSENRGCVSPPIYQTDAYAFGSSGQAGRLFALEEEGDVYSRLSNPTVGVFEKRMALLEGGAGAVAFSSGHAAIYSAAASVCGCGDEIVSDIRIYGGAINMLSQTLGQFGIKTVFVNGDDPRAWEAAVTDRTRLFFFETVGNPNASVSDIEMITAIAERHGILTMADSTFTTPYLIRPLEWGADLVVHSATKFICGHGSAMGGVVIDGGKFRYEGNPRYTAFYSPDPSYHGVNFCERFPDAPFAARLRSKYLRDIGGCLSAFSAYLMLTGLETLPVRMARHCENAEKVAGFLASHPRVLRVNYPGLAGSPYHERAARYLPRGCGSIFTCELAGGRAAAARFMDSLRLFANVANVGDLRSMVIHPATTTHAQLTDSQLAEAGIGAGTVRVSVGLEDPEDLILDLGQALESV